MEFKNLKVGMKVRLKKDSNYLSRKLFQPGKSYKILKTNIEDDWGRVWISTTPIREHTSILEWDVSKGTFEQEFEYANSVVRPKFNLYAAKEDELKGETEGFFDIRDLDFEREIFDLHREMVKECII